MKPTRINVGEKRHCISLINKDMSCRLTCTLALQILIPSLGNGQYLKDGVVNLS